MDLSTITSTVSLTMQCPYDVVVPTMRQGIEMAMMFTSMFSGGAGGLGGGSKRRKQEL